MSSMKILVKPTLCTLMPTTSKTVYSLFGFLFFIIWFRHIHCNRCPKNKIFTCFDFVFCQCLLLSLVFLLECWPWNLRFDNDVIPTSGSWLYTSIHDPRNQHTVFEASHTTHWLVFVFISILLGCVDLHGLRISLYFPSFVRIGSDGARRLGKPSSLQGTRRSGEHMVDYEHYMALDRLIDGARLWHSAEVRGYYIGIILCYRSIIFQSCLNSVGHWNVVVLRSNDAEFLHG